MEDVPAFKYIWRGHHDAGFFCHALSWRPTPSPLCPAPGNQPPADEPYLCIIPLLDYSNLSRAMLHQEGAWHFSKLDERIIADCRARKCVIVFDLCNEGPGYNDELFSTLISWVKRCELPKNHVVWLAQNRVMRDEVARHAGDDSELIDFLFYDFFVKCIFWKFSPWFPEPVLGRDENAAVVRMLAPHDRDKVFLCLNATPRLTRILTIAAIKYYAIDRCSLYSFPGLAYVKEGDGLNACLEFVDRNPCLSHLKPIISDVIPNMPSVVADNFAEKGNQLFDKIDLYSYDRTRFSVVTETEMSDGGVVRITEKLAKAYCLGHPAVVIGNPFSLRLMETFGFVGWGPALDRGYDEITDPAKRFTAATRVILKNVIAALHNPSAWRSAIVEAAEANIRHAVSGRALTSYIEHYDDPILRHLAGKFAAPSDALPEEISAGKPRA